MTDTPMTRHDFETMIIAKAADDEGFRETLVAEPKRAIQEAFGITLGDDINVSIIEEGANDVCIVLPDFKSGFAEGEMSDADLHAVSGGSSTSTGTCGSSNCSIACGGGGAVMSSVSCSGVQPGGVGSIINIDPGISSNQIIGGWRTLKKFP